MLSEEEKERIRAEEQRKLEQGRRDAEELRRREAAVQYRQRVARTLRGRRNGWRWAMGVLALAGLGGGGWWLTQPGAGASLEPDEAAFVERCKAEVAARVEAGWRFPEEVGIKAALSVDAEGRSWQGRLEREGRQQSFLCVQGAASSGLDAPVRLELFGEESP